MIDLASEILDEIEKAASTPKPVFGEIDSPVPIWKHSHPDKQIVYGVVMQPRIPDAEGDIVSQGEIEAAAHRFLVASRKHDVQHDEQTAAVTTVESWIAPYRMEIAGRLVPQGAWVMAVRVDDPGIWQQVKSGELTGFSIGGTAVRT